jgi:LacI family transcriptional regulator
VIDNIGTGYTATRHLIQQGCKRIAIVTSSLERNVYADRYKGYRNALYDYNIAFADHLLILNSIREEAGAEAARQIMAMKESPDGLFITNDLVAAVCMRTLMEYGVRVPDDIAIVGFNNDSICKLTVPTITTINYPGLDMGRTAVAALISNITGKDLGVHRGTAVIPANLVVRHSSLKNAHC